MSYLTDPVSYISKFNVRKNEEYKLNILKEKSDTEIEEIRMLCKEEIEKTKKFDFLFDCSEYSRMVELCEFVIASRLDKRVRIEISSGFINGEFRRNHNLEGYSGRDSHIAKEFYVKGYKEASAEITRRLNKNKENKDKFFIVVV